MRGLWCGAHGGGEGVIEKPCAKLWVVSPFRSVRHRLSVSTSFVLAALGRCTLTPPALRRCVAGMGN
jgi:hypothetical protein